MIVPTEKRATKGVRVTAGWFLGGLTAVLGWNSYVDVYDGVSQRSAYVAAKVAAHAFPVHSLAVRKVARDEAVGGAVVRAPLPRPSKRKIGTDGLTRWALERLSPTPPDTQVSHS
jgi:hypothetical protein